MDKRFNFVAFFPLTFCLFVDTKEPHIERHKWKMETNFIQKGNEKTAEKKT